MNPETLADVIPAPDTVTARRLLAILQTKESQTMETKTTMRFPGGSRLREARDAAGFSIEQVAVELGRSAYTVHGYELGRIEPPVHILVQMCRMFDASIGDVVGES